MYARSRFDIGAAGVPLTKRFYGFRPIDDVFGQITVAFALLQFGHDANAYWQSLVFLTDFAGLYAIILLESSRRAYRSSFFSYPLLFTFFAQVIPVGLLGPLYYFALSVFAPLDRLVATPDARRLDPATLTAVLPTVVLAYYVPHVGSYWPASLEQRHWWNWVWQLYGVWGSLLLFVFSRAQSRLGGSRVPASRATGSLRVSVGILAAIGTLTYWYAAGSPNVSLLEALMPRYLVRNPEDVMVALRTILQYDYICSFGAVYIWLGYQFHDLKAAGLTTLPWVRIATVAAVATLASLVPQAVSVLAPVFEDDPAIAYVLNALPREERLSYLPAYFTALLTAAALNRAVIYEAASWKCTSVVMPPGEDVGNPWTLIPAGLVGLLRRIGFGGCKKMIWEFTNLTGAAKKREMGKGRYYYVFFIGTAVEGRGQGLASKLIEEAKERAAKEGLPLGFKDLGGIVLGKDKVGADGERKSGGEGVTIWPMIWRPSSTKS
ncbi:Dimeric alpha-beta barrel [Purpureocillium lavendulum]|uniref:Dimeric alpha-beta barrel n=1 Tax=Purpureocillium lavendulum TaxID=1247861 RepID=A0AB34G870_9HYPO|nr:Dimeric alpha-beta barrel [Purpureocillium lavendulum]